MARIIETKSGSWELTLDVGEMRALVSMVRLEIDSGWEGSDDQVSSGGGRLARAIDRVWGPPSTSQLRTLARDILGDKSLVS